MSDDLIFEFISPEDGVKVEIFEGTLDSNIRVYEDGRIITSIDCMSLLEGIKILVDELDTGPRIMDE